MAILQLSAKSRGQTGKGPARQLRMTGVFPGIVYGGDLQPSKVTLNSHDFEVLLHAAGENPLINLTVEGEKGDQSVIVRDIQRHPTSQKLVHVDLFRVRLDEKMEFEVHIAPKGSAVGVKEGGVLELIIQAIRVSCLPTEVPEQIAVEVAHLGIKDTIRVKDLTVPEGIEVLDDPEDVAVTVLPPRVMEEEEVAAEEEEEAAEGEEAAEPEVIGAKKEKEEEKEGE